MNYQEKVLCHRYHPHSKINNGIRMFIISKGYPREFLFVLVPPWLVVISDTLLMKLEVNYISKYLAISLPKYGNKT